MILAYCAHSVKRILRTVVPLDMPTSIPSGQVAFFDLDVQNGAGVSHHAAFSVKSLDYVNLYVALRGASRIYAVPKVAGFTGNVSVQISGTAPDGTVLPAVTVDFALGSPPPPPDPLHLVVGAITVVNADFTNPPDPGADTITGSL